MGEMRLRPALSRVRWFTEDVTKMAYKVFENQNSREFSIVKAVPNVANSL